MPYIEPMPCFKCDGMVSPFSSGAGWSWSLFLCEKCKQPYIKKMLDGFYPPEVWKGDTPIDLDAKIALDF